MELGELQNNHFMGRPTLPNAQKMVFLSSK